MLKQLRNVNRKFSNNFKQILNKYQVIKKLGEGSYGVVYLVINTTTNQKLAIKKIKMEDNHEGIPSTSLREISILKMLKHPNVVK